MFWGTKWRLPVQILISMLSMEMAILLTGLVWRLTYRVSLVTKKKWLTRWSLPICPGNTLIIFWILSKAVISIYCFTIEHKCTDPDTAQIRICEKRLSIVHKLVHNLCVEDQRQSSYRICLLLVETQITHNPSPNLE